MPRDNLEAIFFDIDDTLYSTTQFTRLARKKAIDAMRKIGLNLPSDTLYRELEEVIVEFSSNYPYHFNKLLLRIPQKSYEGINPSILIAAAICSYHDVKHTALRPFPDVIPCLKSLAKLDIIKGIITDGLEIKQAEKLLRLKIYQYFSSSAIFISDQIGISKPNPKLFLYACQEMRITPSQAMYVGDNWLNDVEPAGKIKMITVLCNRGGKYSSRKGKIRPNYVISNFYQLLKILKKDFGLPVKLRV